MPASTTLSTTTFTKPVGRSDSQVRVASTSGITAGMRLFVDRESMSVVSLGVSTLVNVRRGVDGTLARDHDTAVPVYIATGEQLFEYDPQGWPAEAIMVSPHINVRTGDVWFARGDVMPTGQEHRWWQKQTITRGIGALGIRTETGDPTSST
jgi:hypothetical protein